MRLAPLRRESELRDATIVFWCPLKISSSTLCVKDDSHLEIFVEPLEVQPDQGGQDTLGIILLASYFSPLLPTFS